jgi:hypothetical protein
MILVQAQSSIIISLGKKDWRFVHYEKSHPLKPHYPTIKTYNTIHIQLLYVAIPWVLQLLCNYPFRNTMY